MNLEEYKIFHQLAKIFEKASKANMLKQLLVDQRNLKLKGNSQNYEWTLTAVKHPKPK